MKKEIFTILLIIIVKIGLSQTIKIEGTVLSSDKTPIIYANVWVKNTSIGTITNSQGRFVLNIPEKYKNNYLVVSCIGYSSYENKISSINKNIRISLKKMKFKIPTVDVVSENFIKKILEQAYSSINKNYPTKGKEYQVFFQNKLSYKDSILLVGEAILQINKGSYRNKSGYGQIKILDSRKYDNSIDTINKASYAGAPFLYIEDDAVKTRANYINPSKYKNYKYKFKGTTSYKGDEVYVFDFEGKKSDIKGTLYIDKKTFAYYRISVNYSLNQESLSGKIYHKSKTIEYTNINGKMYLKYLAVKLDIIDYGTQKKLNANFIFITTKVKDEVKHIPSNQLLLTMDDYMNKFVKSEKSNWKNYNILKQDSVFLSQKYFLSEQYNTQNSRTITDYINKYFLEQLTLGFSVGFIPVNSISTNYNLQYFNNNKIYKTEYNAPFVSINPVYGIYSSYFLTRNHIFLFSFSNGLSKNFYTYIFDIGYKYSFKLNKIGKPVYLRAFIGYSSRKSGVFTGDFTGENEIVLQNKILNKDVISSYSGYKEQGVSSSLIISYTLKPEINLFISGSYFYSFNRTPIIILKEKEGFFLSRKVGDVNFNDNIIYKENNIKKNRSSVIMDNLLLKIGIQFGLKTN